MQVAIFILVATLAVTARGEKGDTYTAEMTAETLPPGSSYVPAAKKANVFLTISDNGIKSDGAVHIWTADMFSLGKTTWERIVLVSTKLPGSPEIVLVSNVYQPDFPNGNFTGNGLPNAMAASGLSMADLNDNSTYAVTVLNSTANTAIGGPLLANFIAAYGNGSIADTVSNTTNPLESDIIFVGDMNNRTVSFPQGFTSGLTPTNGTGSIIFQQLGDGTFLWSLEIAIMQKPSLLELRYFVDLDYQPLVLNLGSSAEPPLPRTIPADADSFSFEGNFTTEQIVQAVTAIGLDWNVVNFNSTPPPFLVTLTDKYNGSILGFVFNADSAPTPAPVIKGAAQRAQGLAAALIVIVLSILIGF